MELRPFQHRKHTSRWLIFIVEQVLCTIAFIGALLLARQFRPLRGMPLGVDVLFLVNVLISMLCMVIFQTYAGIIRYSSMHDVVSIFKFSFVQFILWMFFLEYIGQGLFETPMLLTVMLVNALLSGVLLISFRLLIKEAFHLGSRIGRGRVPVLVYGAGLLGVSTMRALEMDKGGRRRVHAFVDEQPDRIGKHIGGRRIISADSEVLSAYMRRNGIRELIIADEQISKCTKAALLSVCSEHGIRPSELPPVSEWMNGRLEVDQLRSVTIESILNRESIVLPNGATQEELKGRTILVTGAAGSIGSEICRQLCGFGPARLVLLDQSESGLHAIMGELSESHPPATELCIELASIRDESRIDRIVRRYAPDFIFHAAAYKHVPILEQFPSEVVLTNIHGTRLLADAARRYHVGRFVMVSTDKAVNPANLMGASKRIAEMYVHSLQSGGRTQFITTRFGNVLGSNGSVVPIFRRQIEKGGPVTVTHPEITRYFMTIPEASSLVIEASVMGTGGEIYVFDMGAPEKILNMARKMIQLAGLRPDVDVRIAFTGLRKGEKLHEELFKSEESPLPTHHQKIMKARHTQVPDRFPERMEELVRCASNTDGFNIRRMVADLVPEYLHQETSERDARIVELYDAHRTAAVKEMY